MGNHEWCPACETSDYHIGFPCDPEKLRAIKERNDAFKVRADNAKVKLDKVMQSLKKRKIKCSYNEHGDLIIEWYQFLDKA